MKRLILLVLLAAVMQSGCCSYMVAKGSADQVTERRAIQAREMNGTPAIAVDLLSLDALGERPLLQLGAALLDAGIIYGAYRGVQEIAREEVKPAPSVRIEVHQGANSRLNIQPGAQSGYYEGQGFNTFGE